MSVLLIINRYKHLLLSVLLFVAGWYFNGLRWESKYADQLETARDTEQALQEAMDADTIRAYAEMQRTIDKRDAAIDRLLHRAARMPEGARANCKGATGAELSREDGSFLIREAAASEQYRQGAMNCYAAYDKIKAEINGD